MPRYFLMFFLLFCVGTEVCNEARADGSSHLFRIGSNVSVPPNNVYKRVVVIGGNLNFSGRSDTILVVGGDVQLEESAVVGGSVTVVGGRIAREEGAAVGGSIQHLSFSDGVMSVFSAPVFLKELQENWFQFSFLNFFRGIWVVLQGLFCLLLFPLFRNSTDSVLLTLKRRPLASACVAALISLLWGLILVTTVLSLIGILFIPGLLALTLCFFACGVLLAAQCAGTVLRFTKMRPPAFVEFVFGYVLLSCVWLFFPWGSFLYLSSGVLMLGVLFLRSTVPEARRL